MPIVQVIKFGERKPATVSAPRRYRGPLDEGRPPAAWRMIYLACGHLTTPEVQELYRMWKPKRGLQFCESGCSKWVKATDWYAFHGVTRPVETQEPLF